MATIRARAAGASAAAAPDSALFPACFGDIVVAERGAQVCADDDRVGAHVVPGRSETGQIGDQGVVGGDVVGARRRQASRQQRGAEA